MNKLDCYMGSSHLDCCDNWIDCLDWAAKAGFSGVEFFHCEGKVAFEDLPDERCAQIAAHAKNLGLDIVAHPWVDWAQLPEKELADAYQRLVRRCASMGMRYINMHLNFLSDRRQGMSRLFRATDACLQILADANLTLLYENVPAYGAGDLGSEVHDFEELFEYYPIEAPVKMNIDTGHANIMHSMQPLAENFGDRWVYTHINDNNQLKDEHVAPAQGVMDFEIVASLAKQAGYTGPLLMEYNQHRLEVGMAELNRTYGAEGYILDEVRL